MGDPDIINLYNSINGDPDYLEGPNNQLFFQTPLHIAASEGHTRLALEMLRLKPSLGKKLNPDGLCPLDLALRNGHTATVKGLIRYDPNLIRVQGREGITPLHRVVEMENIELLIRFLLECPSSIKDLTVRYETAVHIAVRKQKFRAFKVLLGWIQRTDNRDVLTCRDEEGNTLLHVAALTNQPQLNLDGLSPLDMALRNNHTATVKGLIRYDPELIRVQGRGGITPLHYLVEMEIIDLLIRFLLECPSSINDLTVRQETAVHIAVRKRNFRAFKVLIGWIKRTDNTTMLRWGDDKGNTVLHLAALTNQPQVVRLLFNMVDVNAENSEGRTALDILPLDIRSGNYTMRLLAWSFPSFLKGTPSEYLSSKTSMYDLSIQFGAYLQFGLSGEIRSAFLVIIALVATATYHAALTPPSAFSNGQNTFVNAIFPNTTSVNATTYILPNSTNIENKTQITKFTIVNTICFGMAMGTSFILTFHPLLYAFLYGPLILFLVAYAFLMRGILNTGSIISAMLVACWVPISSVIPWWIIIIRKDFLTKRSDDYSLSEAIYLIFSSKYASRRSKDEGAANILSLIFRN